MTFILTAVCRQPLGRGYLDCDHDVHGVECCTYEFTGEVPPKGHEHGQKCCIHDCDEDGCPRGTNYAASAHGTHRQCGVTATFEASGPTIAVDDAVRAGWFVDNAVIGQTQRADVCPDCNEVGRGARYCDTRRTVVTVYDLDGYDAWTAA